MKKRHLPHKHRVFYIGIMLFQLLFVNGILAQDNYNVRGIVKNEYGETISGVTVRARNTDDDSSFITKTDHLGAFKFRLAAAGHYSFTISYVGYQAQTLSGYHIKGVQSISLIVKLKELAATLSDVVVVGYGTQKKKDITTAISGLRAKDLEGQPVSNVAEAMAGKMPGVQIVQSTGEPGSALNIKVRGVGTITAGSKPLYVIDGIPVSSDRLNSFNMNDIESVEVLKDASSAAIYGSRGSNGVVLISTKQGKSGITLITYNGYSGIQQVSKKIDMLDAYQYADLTKDGRNNTYVDQMQAINRKRVATGSAPLPYSINDDNATRLANSNNNTNTIIPLEIVPYLEGKQGLINTNWQDQIFRNALIQDHSVAIGGGGEKSHYYSSIEYFSQDGIIINSNFKRYSGRLNLESEKGRFKFGINLSPSFIRQNRISSDGAYFSNGIVSSALHYAPIWPVYNPDGSYSFAANSWSSNTKTILGDGTIVGGNAQTQAYNPVALAMLPKEVQNDYRILGSVFTEARVLKDLNYKITFGVDLFSTANDRFRPSTFPQSNTEGNPETEASGSESSATLINWMVEQTLNYKKEVNDHTINLLAGWTAQKEHRGTTDLTASRGFTSNDITTLNAGIVTNGSTLATEWALLSGLGRLQYAYKGRYLLTSAIRADGASRFGKNNKWGYYPSVSVGWRLSDEAFMKKISFINDLKLRTSYGLTGNFNIPDYGALGSLGYYGYVIGGNSPTVITGSAPNSQPNPSLKWEKTAQLNFGFDLTFLKNHFTIGFDVYNSNTHDLLLNVPVPLSTGYTSQLTNIGKVNNKGLELNLSTQYQFGELKWYGSANFSKNINTVKQLGPGNADILRTGSVGNAFFITRVGQPIGSYYLPVVLGVFKNQQEINNYPHYIDSPNNYDLATAKPGDFKFKDVDGNGVFDPDLDRAIVGNYMPKFTYGFATTLTYKRFALAIAAQGVYGNKILNLSRRYFYSMEGNMNNYVEATNRFKSEVDPGNGTTVRANRVAKGNNGITSTWHVEDGSYLRIRNLTLSFTLPEATTKKIAMTNFRVYLSFQNPFTFTKYSGYNPEVSNSSDVVKNGEDYGVYPTTRVASIGLNITF
jgi:TonB-linked SusC/RagA family outer membrane protein